MSQSLVSARRSKVLVVSFFTGSHRSDYGVGRPMVVRGVVVGTSGSGMGRKVVGAGQETPLQLAGQLYDESFGGGSAILSQERVFVVKRPGA